MCRLLITLQTVWSQIRSDKPSDLVPRGGGGGCEITKLFSCSKSIEHEILAAHKTKILKIKTFIAFRLSDVVLILLINVKMPTIVGILTLMSKINFMLT